MIWLFDELCIAVICLNVVTMLVSQERILCQKTTVFVHPPWNSWANWNPPSLNLTAPWRPPTPPSWSDELKSFISFWFYYPFLLMHFSEICYSKSKFVCLCSLRLTVRLQFWSCQKRKLWLWVTSLKHISGTNTSSASHQKLPPAASLNSQQHFFFLHNGSVKI